MSTVHSVLDPWMAIGLMGWYCYLVLLRTRPVVIDSEELGKRTRIDDIEKPARSKL